MATVSFSDRLAFDSLPMFLHSLIRETIMENGAQFQPQQKCVVGRP